MKIRYFAWVRERIRKAEDDIVLPATVVTGADLIAHLTTLGEEYGYAFERPEVIRVAVDQVHVLAETDIRGAREVALFPPMTGGEAMAPVIRVQAEPFDVAAETARMSDGRTDIGALVTFTGLCRAEDGRLSALELEHYPGMAEAEIARVVDRG